MQQDSPFILEGDWNSFLTLPDEKLLIVKRKHAFLLFSPIIFTLIIGLCFLITNYIGLFMVISSFPLFLSSSLCLLILIASFIFKIFIDWYFHLYVVTSRKILEIRFAPLNAHVLNSVLLDQVNCTEVDIKTDGLINELIDMGDIIITFDRPTHQEEFTFLNIKDSRKIGAYLSDHLINLRTSDSYSPMWYRPKVGKKYRFMEEIFSNPAL